MNAFITGQFGLDWAILALSLFNMVLLLWLGATVALNAERRTWGHVLAAGGLLLAGILFLAHTAIVGRGIGYAGRWMNFWWGLGWAPALLAPFAWYVEMLWYAGFWDSKQSGLRQRHQFLLPLAGLLVAILTILPVIDPNPLPSYSEMASYKWGEPLSFGVLPLLVLIYPFYSVLCFGLSLDALRRPALSNRVMGGVARRRARPWLAATAVVLLSVSLLGTGSLVWFIGYGRHEALYLTNRDVLLTLAWLDVIVSGLIAVATLLLGQAVTSYEIFTGKSLPRRGLSRHWRSAVILAGGYGILLGWSLALQMHPIYGLLMSTVLMVSFYALFNWRSYVERERYIEHLRPFVASQRLYEDVLAGPSTIQGASPRLEATTPFHALCRDVLGTSIGYLAAVGPLSPLVGSPLVYRDGNAGPDGIPNGIYPLPSPMPSLTELTAQFASPRTICTPIDPTRYGGAEWAVPLWSERGLVGMLLLGKKLDGGLYAQEEIEIARASGERLVDTQASVAMAQRLMSLQRQRLTESQVLDRRTRRVLHDDVLPLLHTAMLVLSGPPTRNGGSKDIGSNALSLLGDAHRQIATLLREMPSADAPEVARLGLLGALRKLVREEFGNLFDNLEWKVDREAEQQAEHLPTLAAEVIFYAAREAIRNAARHARPVQAGTGEEAAGAVAPLHLTIAIAWRDGLMIMVEDDGVGFTQDSPSNAGDEGSGQGLALHSTLMAVVGGSLSVESLPGSYTRVLLALPIAPAD
jgi:signal transduction histidine kinase